MVDGQAGSKARDAVRELETALDSLAGQIEAILREVPPDSPVHSSLTGIAEAAARARTLARDLQPPAAPAPTPGAALSARSSSQVPRGDERVLLVDDEPMVRSAHRRLLASLGYQVTAVADGQEALELLRAAPEPFDLVMTDQTMPHLTGVELAVVLRSERPGLPVLLCSGFSDSPEETAATEAGVAACLQKPIDRAALATLLRQVLEAHKGTAAKG